jgi:hypothetical protein
VVVESKVSLNSANHRRYSSYKYRFKRSSSGAEYVENIIYIYTSTQSKSVDTCRHQKY